MASTKITNFNSLMSPDIRSSNGFARIQHFKVFPHKLVPQFSTEADETKTLSVVKFIYAPWLSTTAFRLWGLGVDIGNSRPGVWFKDSSSDPIGSAWSGPSSNVASGGARSTDVFFYYKGYLYCFKAGTDLSRYGKIDDTSGASFTDAYQSITYTNVAQPVHHPADDCAYFFADNKVYRLNNTTWDGLVLTLPDNMIIASGSAYGDYLEISCKSKTGLGDSITYIWDRDSSLSTVTAKPNWGRGNIVHSATLEGVLTVVMDYFTNSALGHTSGKLVVKQLIGGQPKTVAEFPVTATSYFTGNKFVADEKLHFTFEMARDGGYIHGIWSVDARGRVEVPASEAETDAITAGLRYQGIYKTGEYWWIAHSNDGSVNRTNDQNTYSYTSIMETQATADGDQSQFYGAMVPFEPLPSGASVSIYCRKLGTASWGTVMKTVSTVGATELYVSKDGGAQAPVFSELQFRIEATGGAVITASPERPIEFVSEPNSTKPYGRK